MPEKSIFKKVKTGLVSRRLKREKTTVGVMIRMYCRHHHDPKNDLCAECERLFNYATKRIDTCVIGEDKPTCANCHIHCYKKNHRETIRQVMRFAGPRMLTRHPVLAVFHLLDSRRSAKVNQFLEKNAARSSDK